MNKTDTFQEKDAVNEIIMFKNKVAVIETKMFQKK